MSNSRTGIACSWFSCIDGFHRSSRPSRSSAPRPSCWHRAGFRRYWRWKSRPLGGRPKIAADLRALIRQMSAENPPWEAPRVHGELLKLGFEVAQSSVAKYMVKMWTAVPGMAHLPA